MVVHIVVDRIASSGYCCGMLEEDLENKVVELYETGMSFAKVSKETGVSTTTVRRICSRRKVVSRSTRTDADIERDILERYNSGESSEKIATDVGMNGSTICRIVTRLGGIIRPSEENKRKYAIREDFFHTIDTEEKAYLLGFLYADGSVHKRDNSFKVEINKQDIDMLEKFIDAIFINDRPKIGVDTNDRIYITVSGIKIKQDLITNGCVPDKAFKIRLPKLRSKAQMFHFLRGMYDGDGCIHIGNVDDSGKKRVRVILTCFHKFIADVEAYLIQYGIYGSVSPSTHNDGNSADLSISTREMADKLLELLYGNATIYLDRKYKTHIEARRILKEQIKKI